MRAGPSAWDHLGNFFVSATWNPSVITVNGTDIGNLNSGTDEIIIQKRAKDGSHIWSVNLGSESDDVIASIVWNEVEQSLIVYGDFYGTLNVYNSIMNVASFQSDTRDIFIARISTNGDIIQLKSYGNNGDETASSLAVNPTDGSIIIGGYTTSPSDSVIFDENGFQLKGTIDQQTIFWVRITAVSAFGRLYNGLPSEETTLVSIAFYPLDYNSILIAVGTCCQMTGTFDGSTFVESFVARVNVTDGTLTSLVSFGRNAPFISMVTSCHHVFLSGVLQSSSSGVSFGSISLNTNQQVAYVFKLPADNFNNPEWGHVITTDRSCKVASDNSGSQYTIGCTYEYSGVYIDGSSTPLQPNSVPAVTIYAYDYSPLNCPFLCQCPVADLMKTSSKFSE